MPTRSSPLAYVPGLSAVVATLALAMAFPGAGGGFAFVVSTPLQNAWPFLAAGVIAYRAFPDSPVARLLLLVGTLQSVRWVFPMAIWALDDAGATGSAIAVTGVVFDMVSFASIAAVVTFIALLPTGRVERRYERNVLRVVWALTIVPLLWLLVYERVPMVWWLQVDPGVASPAWIPALSFLRPMFDVLREGPVVLPIGLVLLAMRYTRADAGRRRVLRGLLIAAAVVVASDVLRWFMGAEWLAWVGALAMVYVFGAVLVALFKHRLLGAEIAIRKSAIYGFL
ncbi:MAG: hypothetical protein LC722_03175, partial [Actinobacteria bacterium]|nr:hypothetical protein [Actinomycetota bacterium]